MTLHVSERLGRFFDWHGKTSRLRYFETLCLGMVLTLVAYIPVLLYTWSLFQDSMNDGLENSLLLMAETELVGPFYVAVMFWAWFWTVVLWGMCIGFIMATVRRLADMGFRAWWVLLLTVPLINIIFVLVLFIWPGRKPETLSE